MIKRIKEWLMNEEEGDRDEEKYKIVQYEIHNYDLLDKIGEDIKNHNFVICIIDENYLIRTLDFISGITFVLDVQEVVLSQNIYLFIPYDFDYKPIS